MPAESQENPFSSPTAGTADEAEPNVNHGGKGQPFSHQAVRFSLYAPILLIAVNLVLRESVGANHPGAKAFAFVTVLAIAAAFLLGLVGMFGSLRRFYLWSIILGLFGACLNGALLIGLVSTWMK